MRYIKTIGTWAAMGCLGLGISSPLLAANECRIQYGYSSGSDSNKKNAIATAYIHRGASKIFNRQDLNFVKNLNNPAVEIFLKNARNAILKHNQVNPPTAFHQGSVTLVKATCLSTGNANEMNKPAALVESMTASGNTTNAIAVALKRNFDLRPGRIAQLLSSGYSIDQIANALAQGLNTKRRHAQLALKSAGYAREDIGVALDNLYGPETFSTNANTNRAIKIANVFHGTYPYSLKAKQCFHPEGRTLYGQSKPIPLPNNNRPRVITITGENLGATNSITGLPRGTRVRITARGNCGIQLELNISTGVAAGTRGNASLLINNQKGPGFLYVVRPLPRR